MHFPVKMYDTKCFVHTRRVRAYIRNGWASNLINPDAIPSPAANEIQSLHPTDGWKSIRNAFTSPSEVPDFSTQGFIQGGGGGRPGISPQKHSPQKNPFSIDIIWHFPGGTCPQTPLGVESPPPNLKSCMNPCYW